MENPDSHHKEQKQEHLLDEKPGKKEFLITGIGASAGGIQALQEFFHEVPADSGVAYVVILHLSPDHDSKLAQILQNTAKIPVSQVKEKTRIEPNHAYVVPPNQHLMMEDGHITVSLNVLMEERRAPVDIFFRTLADEHGSRSICVVLSGTGANGSMGLKRIKERGGATFVQNPREAEFSEMPRNAIATDMVDEVLPVADIPAKIMAYKDNLGVTRISDDAEIHSADQQTLLREIFTQVRKRTGHDFSNYKRPTLIRRIERRLNVRNLPDLASYVNYLQHHPEEIHALLKDLLISVTNFFRDKKAFDVLEQEVVPLLLKEKDENNQLRIWVAGCATGEEAYSVAMICAEKLTGINTPSVQVFATDIDEGSIAHAREGLYSLNDAADVSPERLRRFFNKEEGGYRIRREIRETVMFAHHNFLKDPPFSHLDMITCRNVMIYLNRVAQERVMETFHFALNHSGFLFLGSSESVDGTNDLYAVYNRNQHIFQSRQAGPRSYPIPHSVPVYKPADKPKTSAGMPEQTTRLPERTSYGDLHQQLLEQYAPPSIVVNEEYDIVHLTERAGRYLQISGGEVSKNLLKLIKPELRLELRSALHQCIQRKSAVETNGLRISTEDRTEIINIHVRPVLRAGDTAHGFILVLFEQTNEEQKQDVRHSSDEPLAKHLEEELLRLKMQLRTVIEQHEFQAEDLKASNEELQAMNEELRSAAEELETSKEELQSINEELRTVNQELKVKIEETSFSTNNLQNLINSSDIGTIFLDRSFRVVLFTPAARAIFNLIPADYGRPLSDITSRLDYKNLQADAETVLEKLNTVEREVSTREGKLYLMRITPYRTDEDRIKGVVISFIDITESRAAEKALHAVNERLRITMDSVTDYAIITTDATGLIQGWNTGAERIFGYTAAEATGQPGEIIFLPHDIAAGVPEKEMQTAREQGYATDEHWHQGKDGTVFFMSGITRPLLNAGVTGFVKVARNVTEQKQAEEQVRISEERYRVALQSSEMAAWDWIIVNKKVVWNEQYFNLMGLPVDKREKDVDYHLMGFVHPEDRASLSKAMITAVKTSGILHKEFRVLRADNQAQKWMSLYGRAVAQEKGRATRKMGVMYDVTERKQLEQQKEEFIGIASHELKTPVTSIKAYGELLEEIFEGAEEQESTALIQKLNMQVSRLNSLINDLLDTTKISEGHLLLNPERFDLNVLISERIEELNRLWQKHPLVFKPAGQVTITADKERIRQVLNNLIANAVKYSPSGGDVEIACEVLEQEVKISVADHGIGIPSEMEEKVFDRFFRIQHTQMNLFPGMGLGLYITAGIVRRHGGTIGVKANASRGSIFYFTLPYEANS